MLESERPGDAPDPGPPGTNGTPPEGAERITAQQVWAVLLASWRTVVLAVLAACAVTLAHALLSDQRFTARMELTTVTSNKLPSLGGGIGASLLNLRSGGIEATPALVLRLMRTEAVLREVAASPYPGTKEPLVSRVVEPGTELVAEDYGRWIDRMLRTSVDREAGTIGMSVTHRDSAVARLAAARLLEATTRAFARASRAQAAQQVQAQEARVEVAARNLRRAEQRLVDFLAANRSVPEYSVLNVQRKQIERELDLAANVYTQAVGEREAAVGKELEETPALVVLDPVPSTFAPDRKHVALRVLLAAVAGVIVGAAVAILRGVLRPRAAAHDEGGARAPAAGAAVVGPAVVHR
jgi:uncharacterized protein involved in exopolysaccharide biosynthesis